MVTQVPRAPQSSGFLRVFLLLEALRTILGWRGFSPPIFPPLLRTASPVSFFSMPRLVFPRRAMFFLYCLLRGSTSPGLQTRVGNPRSPPLTRSSISLIFSSSLLSFPQASVLRFLGANVCLILCLIRCLITFRRPGDTVYQEVDPGDEALFNVFSEAFFPLTLLGKFPHFILLVYDRYSERSRPASPKSRYLFLSQILSSGTAVSSSLRKMVRIPLSPENEDSLNFSPGTFFFLNVFPVPCSPSSLAVNSLPIFLRSG